MAEAVPGTIADTDVRGMHRWAVAVAGRGSPTRAARQLVDRARAGGIMIDADPIALVVRFTKRELPELGHELLRHREAVHAVLVEESARAAGAR